MNYFLTLAFFLGVVVTSTAQLITGNLSLLPKQSIKLEGFNGFKTYAISSTTIDEKGNFKLNYSQSDYGVGYLMSADNKPLFVILCGEDIEIMGEALSHTETLKITKGKENQWFEKYAQTQKEFETTGIVLPNTSSLQR